MSNESAGLRIGDVERDAAVTALGDHFAAGRLTEEEYEERSTAAWSARTRGDLTPLFGDLPAPHAPREHTRQTGSASDGSQDSPRRRRAGWPAPVSIVVVAVLATLAVVDVIPWFVAAILAWICWLGPACSRSPRGHPWGHRPGWR